MKKNNITIEEMNMNAIAVVGLLNLIRQIPLTSDNVNMLICVRDICRPMLNLVVPEEEMFHQEQLKKEFDNIVKFLRG